MVRGIGMVLVFLLGFCAAAAAAAPDPLAAEAAASGKPMVVDFGKGQCYQCVKQKAFIEELKGEIGDKVGFRFVHVIKEAETAGAYKVVMIPTIVFLDAGGREVERYVGLLPAAAMRAKIEKLGWIAR